MKNKLKQVHKKEFYPELVGVDETKAINPMEEFKGVFYGGKKSTKLKNCHTGAIENDIQKPKELEWAEEYRKLLKEYQVNAEDWDCFPDLGVKFINDLLTQQRTELLEEIKDEMNKQTFLNPDNSVVDDYVLEQFTNLINKKDE